MQNEIFQLDFNHIAVSGSHTNTLINKVLKEDYRHPSFPLTHTYLYYTHTHTAGSARSPGSHYQSPHRLTAGE